MKTSVWIAVACPSTRRVLVAKRGSTCRNAGQWNFFGGGVDHGERPRKTARRELREEAGIRAAESQLLPLADFIAAGKRNLLFGLTVHVEIKPKLNHESEEFRWLTSRELVRHHLLHLPTRTFSIAVAEWLDEMSQAAFSERPPDPLPAQSEPTASLAESPEQPPNHSPWRDWLGQMVRWLGLRGNVSKD